jgi:hypothetical protein
MGATLDEIIADYFLSFNSIFDSSINDHSRKADAQVVMSLLSVMSGTAAVTDVKLRGIAEAYLKNTIRLSCGEIDVLKLKLPGRPPG